MAKDALAAHAQDELGLSTTLNARPLQAALASAASFAAGAAVPLAIATFAPPAQLLLVTFGASLFCLAGLGALAAKIGGAPMLAGAVRVTFWSALAMAVTAGVGSLFGASPGA